MRTYLKLLSLLVIIALNVGFTVKAFSQSNFLGKSQSYIIQQNGNDYRSSEQDGQYILIYKRVSQKGSVDNDMYYFKNDKCVKIIQGFDLWFITIWGNELSEKFRKIDQNNWLEKDVILHSVAVISDEKFIYIIKYKDY